MESKRNENAGSVVVSAEVQALLDKWKGEVDVVRIDAQAQPSTTRYVDVFITFDGRAAATWCGRDEHTFDMRTGRCIESSDGRMKGWRIAPWEMHRFNPADAQKYLENAQSGGMSAGYAPPDTTTDRLRTIVYHDPTTESSPPVLVILPEHHHGFADFIVSDAMCKLNGVGLHHRVVMVKPRDALVGQRFDEIIATDILLERVSSVDEIAGWWRSSVLPHKPRTGAVCFLPWDTVLRESQRLAEANNHACSSVSTPS